MYDLHCHMLPALDDGAKNLDTALAMACMAVEDGITHLAFTPHIYPGLFPNTSEGISAAVGSFSQALDDANISLDLGYGAEIHVVPELLINLRSGIFPTINQSRYFLFELPHHVPIPNFDRLLLNVIDAGYVPIITHPERLAWMNDHYHKLLQVVEAGSWVQMTAGSLTGRFGNRSKYLSEKMLDDGIVHLLATDAHNLKNRPPLLAEGEHAAVKYAGAEEARRLVWDRPQAIWNDIDPADVLRPQGVGVNDSLVINKKGLLKRIFGT